jgi:hypothetical protein
MSNFERLTHLSFQWVVVRTMCRLDSPLARMFGRPQIASGTISGAVNHHA